MCRTGASANGRQAQGAPSTGGPTIEQPFDCENSHRNCSWRQLTHLEPVERRGSICPNRSGGGPRWRARSWNSGSRGPRRQSQARHAVIPLGPECSCTEPHGLLRRTSPRPASSSPRRRTANQGAGSGPSRLDEHLVVAGRDTDHGPLRRVSPTIGYSVYLRLPNGAVGMTLRGPAAR
jgi:hypothetical protein